jgi:hypothetical protein
VFRAGAAHPVRPEWGCLVRYRNSNNRFRRAPTSSALLLALCSACLNTACGQLGSVNPTVLDGRQFTHSINFPSRFERAQMTTEVPSLPFDHYRFRASSESPNILLVSACKYVALSEVCSANAFGVDTEHGFTTSPVEAGEWEKGNALTSHEMNDPVRRTLTQELAKPAFSRPIPISRGEGEEFQGYKYKGKEYRRRGDWVGALNFANSEDGRLIVLAGVDKRKFTSQEPSFVDAAIYVRPSGLVTLDVFEDDPLHRVASLNLDCHTPAQNARTRISLVDSRWVAIGIDPFLTRMLLLDFNPAGAK